MGIRSAILGALMVAATALPAAAVPVNVGSLEGNITGAGVLTGLVFSGGEMFTVIVDDPSDTWSLGPAPRNFTADGTEVSGANYGTHTFSGQTFRFGTLVGRIGAGSFFEIGLAGGPFTATAGQLALFAWDSIYADNSGSIQVTATIVPLPAGGVLLLTALGAAGVVARKRRKAA